MRNYNLILNAGSSSLKFKLYNDRLKGFASGIVEAIGGRNPLLVVEINGRKDKIFIKARDHESALTQVLAFLEKRGTDFSLVKKIGHRVVHGGEKFIKPTLITSENIAELEKYNRLAPLHNPKNIAAIRACLKLMPKARNYAVFDTAFHATMPDYAYLYPIPYQLYLKENIRRYGFHGISVNYIVGAAARKLKKQRPNLIVCHLGSGASITVVKNGKSIDTSMGFTPLEGLMMGTRSGDIDPEIIIYLEKQGYSLEKINETLNSQSGLKGIAGTNDLREILIAAGYEIPGYKANIKWDEKGKKMARLALKMFIYRIKKYIGAYYAVLGKIDAIVFTAGVGERNADIRKLIMKGLPIRARVLTIPTDEELMIAKLINK